MCCLIAATKLRNSGIDFLSYTIDFKFLDWNLQNPKEKKKLTEKFLIYIIESKYLQKFNLKQKTGFKNAARFWEKILAICLKDLEHPW